MKNLRLLVVIILTIFFCAQGAFDGGLLAQQRPQDSMLLSSVDIISTPPIDKDVIPLAELLANLEQNFDVTFLYQHEAVADKFVNRNQVEIGEKTAWELSRVLDELGLAYNQIDEETIILIPKSSLLEKASVEQQVTGTVTDAESGEMLPGVNIIVKGTMIGTSTDAGGYYELTVPSPNDTLIFSFIGYQRLEVPISGRTSINVQMQLQAIAGEELVVVGYGTQTKSSLTSAVSEISAEEISKKPISNNRQALQGAAPGVIVMDRGGAPGSSDFDIRIRGITTIGNNTPLVLVDGIEQNFNDINPNAIESITVLKDASATAIYGSRGANGVILVTTKNPEQGDLKISYDGYFGIQQISNKPEHLGLEEYMRLQNAAYVNRGSLPQFTEEEIQEYVNAGDRLKYPLPNTMWDAVYSPAPQQNHSLQFSGGTENIKSILLLNYFNQDGIIPNFKSDRFEARLNTDLKLSERINVSANLAYRRKETDKPYEIGAIYWRLFHSTQWTVPQYPDGTYGVSNQGHNPLMYAELSGNRNYLVDYMVANLTAGVDILDNLTYTIQFGGHAKISADKLFRNAYMVHDYYDNSIVLKNVSPNSLEERRQRGNRWALRHLLNYRLDINKNSFNILAGYEEIRESNTRIEAFRQGFYNNDVRALTAGSEENWSNTGNDTEERLRSVFGRLKYSFDGTYIFEANARYDGSSKFYGSNNQYSFFPSFSAAWRVSNEGFWELFDDIVSNFKIRGSWGKTGNNAVDLYTFYPGLSQDTYIFNGQLVNTYVQNSLSNENLTWETTTQTDIGIDMEFLQGMFGLTFDYFKKRTEGILLELPVPGTLGLEATTQNAGIVDNEGWELAVTHRNNVSNDFSYSVSANLSDVKNEVIDLAGTGPYTFGERDLYIQKEGEELNSLYGYKALGFFESEEEVASYPSLAGEDDTYAGDLKYADLNEDGIINGDDRTIIGSTLPHYTFGISANLNYKNFDLNFFIQGVGQADAEVVGAAREGGNWEGFTPEIAGDYWTPENTNARFPRPQKRSRKNTTYNSSWWVVDASYLRLKNINLGYTLPLDITQKIGVNSLRVYMSGRNLFTLSEATKWGIDPEFPSGRINYYPQVKNYSVGVNIEF